MSALVQSRLMLYLDGEGKKGWKGGETKSNGRGAEGEENHFYPDLASIGKIYFFLLG
jgi:hypothetical protein